MTIASDPNENLLYSRVATWTAVAVALSWVVGLVLVARLVLPAPNPAAGSQEIVQFYVEHKTSILISCFLMLCGASAVLPWGGLIAAMTREMEGGLPIWTYTQIACLAGAVFDLCMDAMFWALAAYRAGEQSPDITRMLNDVAWFFVEIPFQPFTAWLIAIAVPILRAKPGTETLPRWSAYLCLTAGFLFIPAGLMMFFKSGPLAYNGVLALYLPAVDFGVWIIGMTVAMVLGLRARAARARAQVADE